MFTNEKESFSCHIRQVTTAVHLRLKVPLNNYKLHVERGFSETKVRESQRGFDKEKLSACQQSHIPFRDH